MAGQQHKPTQSTPAAASTRRDLGNPTLHYPRAYVAPLVIIVALLLVPGTALSALDASPAAMLAYALCAIGCASGYSAVASHPAVGPSRRCMAFAIAAICPLAVGLGVNTVT